MKIWFPIVRGGSGTDIFTRRLAAALERRGFQAEITWFDPKYELFPSLLKTVPAPRGTTVIHANAWNGFAFKRPGIPLVVTEHQGVFGACFRPYRSRAQLAYHAWLIRRYVRASCQAAARVTTVSRFSATGLATTLGIGGSQVIYNWIDTQTFTPVPDIANETNQPFKLLFVGNFTFLKGSDLLPQIMEALGDRFKLSFTTGLKDMRANRLPPNMVSLGRLGSDIELVKAYRSCDALLFPSRFEGFGYAALEAMACGKPVIATNTAALPEVVLDARTGILCRKDDMQAFVDACRFLAAHPNICLQYGQNARERAVEEFSEEAIVPQYLKLYASLVDDGR